MSRQLTKEESDMAGRIIREHGVELRTGAHLREIRGNSRVESVITDDGTEIPCELAGITIGVTPETGFLAGTGIETATGVLVDEYLQTSARDVYAAGDCAELRTPAPARRAVEPLWYTARAMGETVARNVCGYPAPYHQGIWHNAARFFDTEYQIYGQVPAITPPGVRSLYWEHASRKKSVRVNYDLATGAVTGFQTMGIRYRQQVCEHWIDTGTHISDALNNLSKANFDPEFYRRHESEIVSLFQQYLSEKS
jgi:NADPH-dependent 2,4-dienoyl-CoA reductase/sulfur reductase-like enzyme